ncbi:hypothetical protein CYMTET_19391, partial [Cymbomonas tetramitiformis]
TKGKDLLQWIAATSGGTYSQCDEVPVHRMSPHSSGSPRTPSRFSDVPHLQIPLNQASPRTPPRNLPLGSPLLSPNRAPLSAHSSSSSIYTPFGSGSLSPTSVLDPVRAHGGPEKVFSAQTELQEFYRDWNAQSAFNVIEQNSSLSPGIASETSTLYMDDALAAEADMALGELEQKVESPNVVEEARCLLEAQHWVAQEVTRVRLANLRSPASTFQRVDTLLADPGLKERYRREVVRPFKNLSHNTEFAALSEHGALRDFDIGRAEFFRLYSEAHDSQKEMDEELEAQEQFQQKSEAFNTFEREYTELMQANMDAHFVAVTTAMENALSLDPDVLDVPQDNKMNPRTMMTNETAASALCLALTRVEEQMVVEDGKTVSAIRRANVMRPGHSFDELAPTEYLAKFETLKNLLHMRLETMMHIQSAYVDEVYEIFKKRATYHATQNKRITEENKRLTEKYNRYKSEFKEAMEDAEILGEKETTENWMAEVGEADVGKRQIKKLGGKMVSAFTTIIMNDEWELVTEGTVKDVLWRWWQYGVAISNWKRLADEKERWSDAVRQHDEDWRSQKTRWAEECAVIREKYMETLKQWEVRNKERLAASMESFQRQVYSMDTQLKAYEQLANQFGFGWQNQEELIDEVVSKQAVYSNAASRVGREASQVIAFDGCDVGLIEAVRMVAEGRARKKQAQREQKHIADFLQFVARYERRDERDKMSLMDCIMDALKFAYPAVYKGRKPSERRPMQCGVGAHYDPQRASCHSCPDGTEYKAPFQQPLVVISAKKLSKSLDRLSQPKRAAGVKDLKTRQGTEVDEHLAKLKAAPAKQVNHAWGCSRGLASSVSSRDIGSAYYSHTVGTVQRTPSARRTRPQSAMTRR